MAEWYTLSVEVAVGAIP